MCFGGSSDAGSAARAQQQAQQAQINQGVAAVNQAFSGFTPGFYQQRQQAYTNYAMPQLQQQYQQNQNNLLYRLANQGLLRSTAGGQLQNTLTQAAQQQQQNIGNQGLQLAQQLQQQVGQQQNTLVNQAIAGASPQAVGTGAIEAASQFSAPSALPPIGNLFSNWASIYNSNQNNQLINQVLGTLPGGGTGQLGGQNLGNSQRIVG